jgi:hypothetical protein
MIHTRLRSRKAAIAASAVAVVVGAGTAVASAATFGGPVAHPAGELTLTARDGTPVTFEVQDYSFDIEQTLSVGSQSSGAGAGKITFHPLTVTTRPGLQTSALFRAMADGSVFPSGELTVPSRRGGVLLDTKFRLVSVKSLGELGHGDAVPHEQITFEYGAVAFPSIPVPPTGG